MGCPQQSHRATIRLRYIVYVLYFNISVELWKNFKMLVTYEEGGQWIEVSFFKLLAPIKYIGYCNAPVTMVRPVIFLLPFNIIFDLILLGRKRFPLRKEK